MATTDEKGYWIDGSGDAVPPKHIKPEDKAKDKMVEKLIDKALKLSGKIGEFKEQAYDDIETYLEALEKQYGITARNKEGNKSISNFSGNMKIEVRSHKMLDFDVKLNIAKELIDGCIEKWSENSRSEIVVLVRDAFKVDEKGKLDRNRILGLRKLNIKDENWKKAMDIISDSLMVTGKRQYIAFWVKNEDGEWESVPLDIARA